MYTEKSIKNIPITEGFIQNGTLLNKEGNDSVIICLHGLCGSNKTYMNLALRDYIIKNNLSFDCFRLDIYSNEKGAKGFLDFSLEKQAKDIEMIIEFFKKTYKKVYLLGASYSGLAVAILNSENVTKQILADPSLRIDEMWQMADITELKDLENNIFYLTRQKHVPIVFNKDLESEGLQYTKNKAQELLDNLYSPTLIISAQTYHGQVIKGLNHSNPNLTVKEFNADHGFTSAGKMEPFLKEIFNFFA